MLAGADNVQSCHFQSVAAMGAVGVTQANAVLAGLASGIQLEVASGTVIEILFYFLRALGAVQQQRLAKQEIDDEADSRNQQEDHDQRPEGGAHASPFCVGIHIPDHEHVEGEKQTHHDAPEEDEGDRLGMLTSGNDDLEGNGLPSDERADSQKH
jgi:hypothetical protein